MARNKSSKNESTMSWISKKHVDKCYILLQKYNEKKKVS